MAQFDSGSELASLESVAVAFLGARWFLWIWAVAHTNDGFAAAVWLNLSGTVLVVISIGFYLRSRLLFALSAPTQIAAYALYLHYCLNHVYIVDRSWDLYLLSLSHLSVMWLICLYDCYVTIMCTRIYHRKAKVVSGRRGSPNASFINVFSHHMTTPPLSSMETPRGGGSADETDHEAIPAVDFKELSSLTHRRILLSSASSVDSEIFEAYLAVDAATLA